jgi:glutamine---fructose-6-phosphate transaminase (isomerizing)
LTAWTPAAMHKHDTFRGKELGPKEIEKTEDKQNGAWTQAEILSEPSSWDESLKILGRENHYPRLKEIFTTEGQWLMVGCGSSYYAALVAAATWTSLTGDRANAFPASEVLLYPEMVVPPSKNWRPVMISRSGHTSEVLKAAEYLEKDRNLRTLAVSCVAKQPLEEISSLTVVLPSADEKSMVMTRSFSCMILALQYLAARWSGNTGFQESLKKISAPVSRLLEGLPARLEQFVATREFEDYVFLGQGPLFGIANEAMLKVKEMSCSYAQCFHTLEFRHGPKAIVSRRTLVTFFISEAGYAAERDMLEEVKSLGGITLVVTNHADDVIRRSADFLVELNLDVPDYARSIAYIPPAQLLGLFLGRKKGLDSDRPPNLSRAVILVG